MAPDLGDNSSKICVSLGAESPVIELCLKQLLTAREAKRKTCWKLHLFVRSSEESLELSHLDTAALIPEGKQWAKTVTYLDGKRQHIFGKA